MNNIEKDTESEFNTMESQQIRMSGIEDMVASNNMTAMQCFSQMKNLVNSAWKDWQVNNTMSDQNEEMACIKLLADIRQACGDDGQRMQGDLVEYIAELYRKSESVPKDWKPISTAPIGDSVSVDVSTCDEDSTNRVFGVISHCQPDGEGGVIWVCELDHFNFDIQTVKQPISVPKGTQVTTDNSKVTFIQKEYEKFSKWCRDNPAYDLDPRLHAHAGQIGHGGYISHRKSSTVFKGWLAAQEQDHE